MDRVGRGLQVLGPAAGHLERIGENVEPVRRSHLLGHPGGDLGGAVGRAVVDDDHIGQRSEQGG